MYAFRRWPDSGMWRYKEMTTDYLPIDCDQHSVLELLAIRRARVVAEARLADGAVRRLRAQVRDVITRDGAEYLILSDQAGKSISVRLDRLLGLSSPDGEGLWRQKNVVE